MTNQRFSHRWLIAPALFLAFCSRDDSRSLTTPSGDSAAVLAADQGVAGASAVGDVKVGTGPLEILRLRLDRQTPSGASVLRQYADPGQTYVMDPGETVELWAEYPAEVLNPRFKVDWGDGSIEITGCGSCLLKHSYSNGGTYTVKASLDDRVSTTVTRTFTLAAAAGKQCGVRPGSLTTLFARNNAGASGGAVYFTLTPSADLALTAIDVNTTTAIGTALTINVYTRAGTFAGNEASSAGWTLRATGSGVSAGVDAPSNLSLNPPVALSAMTNGVAVVATNFIHAYTNGTGSNQSYTNGALSVAAGSATNVPFSGSVFSPRVPNMTFYYGCE